MILLCAVYATDLFVEFLAGKNLTISDLNIRNCQMNDGTNRSNSLMQECHTFIAGRARSILPQGTSVPSWKLKYCVQLLLS